MPAELLTIPAIEPAKRTGAAACDAEPSLRPDRPVGESWTPRPPWRPLTKFEQRAVQEGRAVRDLIYRRV